MRKGQRGSEEEKRERERERVVAANNSGLNLFCRKWRREKRENEEDMRERERERTKRGRRVERTTQKVE